MKHLTFQLHGSIVSWGKPGGDEERPSYRYPSKSAVLGLVAASMGIKRSDCEEQKELSEGLKFAVTVESPGQEFTDYHTALPPQKEEAFLATRKEEINWGTGNAVVTQRDYRVDSLHTVTLWIPDERGAPDLGEIKESLLSPTFIPYLGRKSCPPGIPFMPETLESDSLKESFCRYWEMRPRSAVLRKLAGEDEITVYWEGPHPEPGLEAEEKGERKDQPLNRSNWTFRKRSENKSVIESG
ncbi:MAG: type I-E CRISPR-associated protein Cas5/CasD [Candidatus Acetothermia bacterium]